MNFIVKKCVQFIKKPLADICNTSFASGIFPEMLKIAIEKPLHKKGNTGEVQNCRPISLLSVFSNIVEKLTYSILMSFVTYLLTLWSRVVLEKLAGLQLVKKFPAFYGTRRFLTALTSALHLSLF